LGKSIPLVTFGHMHHSLRHTKQQLRRAIHVEQETVYLNAARVPRIIDRDGKKWRNFSIVTLHQGQVSDVVLLWLDSRFAIVQQERLYQAAQVAVI
jgi:uncharacterized protein (TIGR04168 family)